MPHWLSRWLRRDLTWQSALIALALPVLAVALRVEFAAYMPRTTYAPFYFAVFIAAWVGGPWMGVAATVFSAVAASFFIFEPTLQFSLPAGDVVPTLIFVVSGSAFALFQAAYRETLRRSDAADRRKADDERWLFAVESSGLGLWQWDLPRKQTTQSPHYRQMLGYDDTVDVIVPDSEFFESVHPDDVPRVLAQVQPHLKGDTPEYHTEFRLRRKDGQYLWIEARGRVVRRDGEGRPLLMLGAHIDVTERHAQLEAVHKARNELQAACDLQLLALQAGELGAWEFTLPDRVLTSDGQSRRVYGLPLDRAPTLDEVLATVHPEDRPRLESAIDRATGTGASVEEQFRVFWPDGTLHWLHAAARAAYENGKPVRLVGLLRAVRDSDTRLLADGIQQMVWIARGSEVIYFNQTCLDFCGTSLESALGYGWIDSLHPDDQSAVRNAVSAAADPDHTNFEQQYRLRRHDGQYRWCIGRGRKLRLTADAEALWYGSTVDVHDLRLALDKAQSADRAKNAFLATTSHELRTPLNSILGFTTLLLDGAMGPLREEQTKPLEVVQRSGRQLLSLVQEILDYSAIEAGDLKLHVQSVPLSSLLSGVRDQLLPRAEARGLQMPTVDCDASLTVMADASRLGQAIRNLAANGVAYTDHGFVRITAVRDGNFARIDVTDSGIGIPADQMSKVFRAFDPIWRGDGVIREGTGLGLAITRRLVESMAGEVGCSSECNVGSRFWVKVPLAA